MDAAALRVCNATAKDGGVEGSVGMDSATDSGASNDEVDGIRGGGEGGGVGSGTDGGTGTGGGVEPATWLQSPIGLAPNAASALWNAMVYPHLRTVIRGVVWYQGEADTQAGYPVGSHASAVNYACTFPALIASWRAHWHSATEGLTDPRMPFGFVQLSTWADHANNTCGDRRTRADAISCDVAVVRWGQTANIGRVPNTRMPNTFMAVAVDLGDSSSPFGDIHPRYKQLVGTRLALASRSVAYEDVAVPAGGWTGPLASTAVSVDNAPGQVRIQFEHTNGAPLQLKHGVGFECSPSPCNMTFPSSEPHGTWLPANVSSVTSAAITLHCADFNGTTPRCVRYNWYNAACMPVVGPEMCAVYGRGALGLWLPAPLFVMQVVPPPPSLVEEQEVKPHTSLRRDVH